jgi:tRNA (Thr-GGU) A37 N-methylase
MLERSAAAACWKSFAYPKKGRPRICGACIVKIENSIGSCKNASLRIRSIDALAKGPVIPFAPSSKGCCNPHGFGP